MLSSESKKETFLHCTNCGSAIAAETSFCANCGTPRGVASTQAAPAAPANLTQPAPTAQTNGLAIASLVLSVLGCSALIGAILGHVALNQIKRTGQNGRGLAIAGISVGWAFTGLWLLYLVAPAILAAGVGAGY